MACATVVLILALVAQATCQAYDTHVPYVPQQVRPVTVTTTVTQTQTIRVPITSDVWVSTLIQHPVFVTHLATEWGWSPAEHYTSTMVMTVTSTPVQVTRVTKYVNPTVTAVSVFTSFVTETENKNLFHSITHVDIFHEIQTVPVSSVQTLVQRVTSTTLRLTTVTVTSTTRGYQ